MRPRRTPTSSLSGGHASHSALHYLTATIVTAIELQIKRIWYRTKARIRGISWGGDSPGTGRTLLSPAMGLPQEIVEMIIARLVRDTPSLRSCSLVCYSWYIAVVSHLHCIIHATTRRLVFRNCPVRKMHTLGLLPFVKTVQICGNHSELFCLKWFNRSALRHFSALTNVQSLGIDNLDVPSFMPRIRQYFGSFSPTLRSLHLGTPKGSNREVIFFIGSFQHLENLSLSFIWFGREPEGDLTLLPPFTPPLRGQLRVVDWMRRRVGLFWDMARLFGGMKFRVMDLSGTDETRFLLRSCAKTLQVLRLHQIRGSGEQLRQNDVRFQANDSIASTHFADFDLSWNKSLQVLEVPAFRVAGLVLRDGSLDAGFLKSVLSTIRSTAFSQFNLVYEEMDFYSLKRLWSSAWPDERELSGRAREEVWSQQRHFEFLREARKAREFSSVLRVDIQGPFGDFVVRMLKEVVAAEKARGGFDGFSSELLVTSDPLQVPCGR